MPHECGLCGKESNTLYALTDVWACWNCWKIEEDPEYIQHVIGSQHELNDYKKTQRRQQEQDATASMQSILYPKRHGK